MSNFLNFAGNSGVTFKSFTSSGGTTYTLDKSASTNSVMVSVGGVMQKPSTDYSVSGATLTTTSTVTSGIVVDTWIIHDAGNAPVIEDNSIVTAKIADNQVTTAKIANSQVTADKLDTNAVTNVKVADDAIGVAELSATGTASSSTYLRGDNAWAEAGGGGWEYVSDTTTSGATFAFTNMVSGYDYMYVLENVTGDTQYAGVFAQFGVAGPTYRSSSYISQIMGINSGGNSNSTEPTNGAHLVDQTQEGMGTGGDTRIPSWVLELRDPASANKTMWQGQGAVYGGTPALQCKWSCGFYNGAAEAHTCIQFDMNSGSFTGGKCMQYRRARS